ncbi:CPXCG motif-containing cysteine-rich protein [Neiella sp. HB171785]|uniref:CPXCG motif-containing cysteine-rich protein n=1 Tax=Neiella litorisoli TaxID=2771431 RepID=A0A8J6UG46_9GAMM|nr:CPXCG motif-containing cysteine-rich protein [Neiella litorisoli]MBD1389581.1 CPXCG motif-containing cysteine-rich protein [Neiella litorisoli]
MELTKRHISCPTCGYSFDIELDHSRGDQDYYDDCPNCCSSYRVRLIYDELQQKTRVNIDADDEQYY